MHEVEMNSDMLAVVMIGFLIVIWITVVEAYAVSF